MGKFSPDDLLNCRACGYDSCEQMAVAVHNGLNLRKNCHYFQRWSSENSLREKARLEAEEKERLHAAALAEVESRLRQATGDILTTLRGQPEGMRNSYDGNVSNFGELERGVEEAFETLKDFLDIS